MTDERVNAKRGGQWAPKCCGCAVGIPMLVAIVLVLIFAANNRVPEIAVPSYPMPANNGYDDFVRAGKMISVIKHKAPASMDPFPSESQIFGVCKSCAEDAAQGLAVLHAALDKPFMCPPERSNESREGDSLSNFALFREVARTTTGVAQYFEMKGEPLKAADALLDGAEMGASIPRGGMMLYELVGIACEAITLNRFEPLLSNMNGSQLAHVARRLEKIADKRWPYSEILLEEGNFQTAVYLESLRQHRTMKETYQTLCNVAEVDEDERPTLRQTWKMARYLFANKETMIRTNRAYLQALAREANKPYGATKKIPEPDNPMWYGSDYLVNPRGKRAAIDADIAILRTEVALRRYRMSHARYPDRLELLVPKYLPTVLDDPCAGAAGKPLKYSVSNEGHSFKLYSLGPDLIDNGGAPANFVGASPGDIVAGHLRRRKAPGK